MTISWICTIWYGYPSVMQYAYYADKQKEFLNSVSIEK